MAIEKSEFILSRLMAALLNWPVLWFFFPNPLLFVSFRMVPCQMMKCVNWMSLHCRMRDTYSFGSLGGKQLNSSDLLLGKLPLAVTSRLTTSMSVNFFDFYSFLFYRC